MHSLPPHRFVVAPLVGQSDLAFRLLCRRHGAELTYSEMLLATDVLAKDRKILHQRLVSQIEPSRVASAADRALLRPFVVQLAGSDPQTVLRAALVVEPWCDAVDLNLGCPQRRAEELGIGAFLLDRAKWPLVFDIVRTLAAHLRVPVTCKIRLLDSVADTVELARSLEQAGCALLAVHGRQRVAASKRRRRDGPADLDAIRAVKAAIGIPVLTNGNVRCPADVLTNLKRTRADGCMVAEALLEDPAIFESCGGDPASVYKRRRRTDAPDSEARLAAAARRQPERVPPPTPNDKRQAQHDKRRLRLGRLAEEYLDLCEAHPPPKIDYAVGHVRWMLGKRQRGSKRVFTRAGSMAQGELKQALATATSLADLRRIVNRTLLWSEGGGDGLGLGAGIAAGDQGGGGAV